MGATGSGRQSDNLCPITRIDRPTSRRQKAKDRKAIKIRFGPGRALSIPQVKTLGGNVVLTLFRVLLASLGACSGPKPDPRGRSWRGGV